jgi:hypothetical protein
MELWYRADFDLVGIGEMTSEHHCITVEKPVTKERLQQADTEAIEWAKDLAKEGEYFADYGNVELELIELHEVDGSKECFPDIRCVWS